MKIVVAFDSFKGSISAVKLVDTVCRAINDTMPDCEVIAVPIADGGEGMATAVAHALSQTNNDQPRFKWTTCHTFDPLMRPITASYMMLDSDNTAVIELAAASGLPLVEPQLRNPLHTTTYGTGLMIKDAIERGGRKFIIGIGGSATNDGGMGLLAALGFKFLDSEGSPLPPTGENLPKVADIDDSGADSRLSECIFTTACDVTNPMCGTNGAAYIFAPQKGADKQAVEYLENGLKVYAQALQNYCGKDIASMPGAGAAGGVGGGMAAMLNSKLQSGSEIIFGITRFDQMIANANFIITGEGRIDEQTCMGKVIGSLLDHADKAHVPVIGIAGSIDTINSANSRFAALFSIQPFPISLEDAMEESTAIRNTYFTALQVAKLIKNCHKN